LQSLVDPGTPAIRSAPRTEQDLIVAAMNRHVLAFDNLSGLPDWLSDALCRLVTDGGFSTRQLYTNGDEMVFEGRRVLILNGIDELARRADLADRSIVLTLPPISEHGRKGGELLAAFEEARPALLGALFDALALGLKRWPVVTLERKPRMADFARWGVACESAMLLGGGSFLELYVGNRRDAAELTLESDVVAMAVRELMEGRPEWEGTPTELLEALRPFATPAVLNSRAWPTLANHLSGKLKRVAPALRGQGIAAEFGRLSEGAKRRRSIRLLREAQASVPIVRAVPPLASEASRAMREPGEDDDETESPPALALARNGRNGAGDE
jgi:hypothetical protein